MTDIELAKKLTEFVDEYDPYGLDDNTVRVSYDLVTNSYNHLIDWLGDAIKDLRESLFDDDLLRTAETLRAALVEKAEHGGESEPLKRMTYFVDFTATVSRKVMIEVTELDDIDGVLEQLLDSEKFVATHIDGQWDPVEMCDIEVDEACLRKHEGRYEVINADEYLK